MLSSALSKQTHFLLDTGPNRAKRFSWSKPHAVLQTSPLARAQAAPRSTAVLFHSKSTSPVIVQLETSLQAMVAPRADCRRTQAVLTCKLDLMLFCRKALNFSLFSLSLPSLIMHKMKQQTLSSVLFLKPSRCVCVRFPV